MGGETTTGTGADGTTDGSEQFIKTGIPAAAVAALADFKNSYSPGSVL